MTTTFDLTLEEVGQIVDLLAIGFQQFENRVAGATVVLDVLSGRNTDPHLVNMITTLGTLVVGRRLADGV